MKLIETTDELAEYCAGCGGLPYVTVDTEFLRERTYYSQLCLVQLARPGNDDGNDAVLVDTLADGLSLDPLYALFSNPDVVKVFHAARQDLEIFQVEAGIIPKPFFDTQVAAMVCGYGDQVGYETLARRIAEQNIDKSSRFTDWSRRPLSEAQKKYAIGDVTHLRVIYEHLAKELEKSGRAAWVEEELSILMNPDTYRVDPENAWQRVKTRTTSPRFLAALKELARFREDTARNRNVPRNRIFKDDAMLEMAANRPKNIEELGNSRLLLREARRGEIAEGILDALRRAEKMPRDQIPCPMERPKSANNAPALSDLLRVFLKARAEQEGVAQKLIASTADLDRLAMEKEPDIAVLRGWRNEVFGRDAMRLKRGEIALSARGSEIRVVPIGG